MAGLMICRHFKFLLAHHHGLAFSTHHDFIFGKFKFMHGDNSLIGPGGKQRSLIDKILQTVVVALDNFEIFHSFLLGVSLNDDP